MANISKYTLQHVAELVFAEEERKEQELAKKTQERSEAENPPEQPERDGEVKGEDTEDRAR